MSISGQTLLFVLMASLRVGALFLADAFCIMCPSASTDTELMNKNSVGSGKLSDPCRDSSKLQSEIVYSRLIP